ncbi:MAG TPA: hypothetical protein VII43_02385 [Opitutaceae bacterium]
MDAPLPDDGFTERVLSALPRRRAAPFPPSFAPTLAWTLSGAGAATALGLVGSSDWGADALARLGDAASLAATRPWILFALAVALVSYVAGLFAARFAQRSLDG